MRRLTQLRNLKPDSLRIKERTINKLRNEKGEITTENSGTQGSKRDYCEQLYGNKINNPGEMDRFLETDRQDWTKFSAS